MSQLFLNLLNAELDTGGVLDNCFVSLYKNDHVPAPGDSHVDYDSLEASGLTAQAITWSDIADDNATGYTAVSDLHEFQRSDNVDDAETAVGYFVYQVDGSAVMIRFAERFETPITLATTLDAVRLVLKYGEGVESEVSASVIE